MKEKNEQDGQDRLRRQDFLRIQLTYHDLDHLAGSWSAEEGELFEKNIKQFQETDQML